MGSAANYTSHACINRSYGGLGMRILSAVACALGTAMLATSLNVSAQAFDHYLKLTPDNAAIGNYPSQKKPVLTVKSGATVKIDGGGGNRWQDKDPVQWVKESNLTLTPAQLEAIKETDRVVKETTHYAGITSGHILIGPIAVEGAMPGDAIEVRILSVTPRIPYGTVSTRPGRGGIPDEVPAQYSHMVMLDAKRNVGVYSPAIEVPLRPVHGCDGRTTAG